MIGRGEPGDSTHLAGQGRLVGGGMERDPKGYGTQAAQVAGQLRWKSKKDGLCRGDFPCLFFV